MSFITFVFLRTRFRSDSDRGAPFGVVPSAQYRPRETAARVRRRQSPRRGVLLAACGGVAAIRRRFHPSNILPISCVCATGEGSEYKRRVRDRKSFSAAATVSRRPSHNPLKETRPPPPPPPDVNPHAQIARTPSVSSARFGVVHFFVSFLLHVHVF